MPNFSIAAEIDLLSLTRVPTAALARGLFAGENGNPIGAGARALGISRFGDLSTADVAAGKEATIGVEGVFPLIVGTAFAKGAEIAADANGKGITAVAGNYVNAIAEEQGVTAGDVVMVRRVQYKI
jgi:hypothetical protein